MVRLSLSEKHSFKEQDEWSSDLTSSEKYLKGYSDQVTSGKEVKVSLKSRKCLGSGF